jgi:Na+/H+ antiporter NhaD/arsenite permease-like protein
MRPRIFAGVPAAMMAAIGAALLLMTRTVEPQRVYDEVDWGLLVFFLGLFVIVGGADRAGLTASLLRPVADWNLHRVPCAILSRSACRLARARDGVDVRGQPHDYRLGRHIIVVEQAAAEGVHVGFREYFRTGLPLTLATLTLGSIWLIAVR